MQLWVFFLRDNYTLFLAVLYIDITFGKNVVPVCIKYETHIAQSLFGDNWGSTFFGAFNLGWRTFYFHRKISKIKGEKL